MCGLFVVSISLERGARRRSCTNRRRSALSKIDPIALATLIKADEKLHSIPLLGFFSHVHAELHREAMSAGYDTVIPRSVFSRDLGEILGRARRTGKRRRRGCCLTYGR